MPHVSSSGGDDLGSTDEVKVFKEEGDGDENRSTENLTEEKSSLIDLTESEVGCAVCASCPTSGVVSRRVGQRTARLPTPRAPTEPSWTR